MESNDKELIEKTKKIKMENLFIKGTYIDYHIQNNWRQAFILDMKPNNRYDIMYLSIQDQIKRKNDISYLQLSFIGDKTNKADNITRNRCLNNEIYHMEIEEVINLLKQKLEEFKIDLVDYKMNTID